MNTSKLVQVSITTLFFVCISIFGSYACDMTTGLEPRLFRANREVCQLIEREDDFESITYTLEEDYDLSWIDALSKFTCRNDLGLASVEHLPKGSTSNFARHVPIMFHILADPFKRVLVARNAITKIDQETTQNQKAEILNRTDCHGRTALDQIELLKTGKFQKSGSAISTLNELKWLLCDRGATNKIYADSCK